MEEPSHYKQLLEVKTHGIQILHFSDVALGLLLVPHVGCVLIQILSHKISSVN